VQVRGAEATCWSACCPRSSPQACSALNDAQGGGCAYCLWSWKKISAMIVPGPRGTCNDEGRSYNASDIRPGAALLALRGTLKRSIS
jgi:hypothetical protein